MSAQVATRGKQIVGSLDVSDAFTKIKRECVIDGTERHASFWSPVTERWLDRTTTHVVGNRTLEQHIGLDQGCPMSPGLYCITVKDALAKTQDTMRQVDQEAVVYAFIDDTYLIGNPAAVKRGCETFAQELALLGLSFNESKTKYWGPNVTAAEMPEAMRPYRVATLKAVGAVVPYARAE
jgi:hypothetical protein